MPLSEAEREVETTAALADALLDSAQVRLYPIASLWANAASEPHGFGQATRLAMTTRTSEMMLCVSELTNQTRSICIALLSRPIPTTV
jgi:hypothetical protein